MASYFGIRHLSSASALHLTTFLDDMKPSYVLIEGPSDCNAMMEAIVHHDLVPPFAIMAYTKEAPIRSVLYPFASYSPEYQAILWAYQHQVPCAFFDVPTGMYLQATPSETKHTSSQRIEFDMDQQDLWEKEFEHGLTMEHFQQGIQELGRQLRQMRGEQEEETRIRESFMRYELERVIASGIKQEHIAIVCGAYHVEGIQSATPLSTTAYQQITHLDSLTTLMPYSYYRLSSLSGYGAGNAAPAYYELLWTYGKQQQLEKAAYDYLTQIATYQREHGFYCSTAEVIEAVQLSQSLAALQGKELPSLQDLQDAAITCLGHGKLGEVMEAITMCNIGTTMGYLPEGMSQTAIQQDVSQQLTSLHLDRFKTMSAQELVLDLRENTSVKSKDAAFLDLRRSSFLHQLTFLKIPFATKKPIGKDQSNWKEIWELKWSSEVEISIIEQSLYGETIALATQFLIKQALEEASNLSMCAEWMQAAFLCGLPQSMSHALQALQSMSIASGSFIEVVHTLQSISYMIRYGSIRRMEIEPLQPVFHQLFYRALLLCEEACRCDDKQAKDVMEALRMVNDISIQHDSYQEAEWLHVLHSITTQDDLNPLTCGYATAILLERGKLSQEVLQTLISMRLSFGTPCEIAALWFEGLMMKNHYALIARGFIWEQLDTYLQQLSEESFRYALVYLRRAFSGYHAKEKYEIAMNLGAIWKMDQGSVAQAIQTDLKEEEQKMLDELADFDFGEF